MTTRADFIAPGRNFVPTVTSSGRVECIDKKGIHARILTDVDNNNVRIQTRGKAKAQESNSAAIDDRHLHLGRHTGKARRACRRVVPGLSS